MSAFNPAFEGHTNKKSKQLRTDYKFRKCLNIYFKCKECLTAVSFLSLFKIVSVLISYYLFIFGTSKESIWNLNVPYSSEFMCVFFNPVFLFAVYVTWHGARVVCSLLQRLMMKYKLFLAALFFLFCFVFTEVWLALSTCTHTYCTADSVSDGKMMCDSVCSSPGLPWIPSTLYFSLSSC